MMNLASTGSGGLVFLRLLLLVGLFTSLAESVKRPLIITRRRHEINFLQASRQFQQNLPYEEYSLGRQLELNFTSDDGTPQKLEFTYYVNDRKDANEVNYDHLVVGSLNEAYTSRLYRSYMFSYDRKEDRSRASDKKLVSKERCRRELDYLLDNLNATRGISPELMAFYDSYGQAETGLITGNIHWLGKANQCTQRLVIDVDETGASDPIAFRGRHCVASIKSPKWNKLIRAHRDRLLKAGNYFKYDGQAYDYERFFRIQVGICLPESCDSESIDWAHQEIKELTMHKLKAPFNSYDLINLFCYPDETSELRRLEPMAQLLLVLALVWLLVTILFTCCDSNSGEEERPSKTCWAKLVSALSFKRNWKRFMHAPEVRELGDEPRASDLAFLNFFKTIFMPAIICGHLGILGYELKKYANLWSEDRLEPGFHVFVGAVSVVNWFYVITGFITSYVMSISKIAERNKPLEWLYAIFHRYWRLAPIYLVTFWFSKHLLIYVSNGPVWDYGTNNMTLRGLCRAESWWYPLTLTSNFHPLHDECIMGSWYVSSDMQFFLLAPFLMIALYKWPGKTYLAIFAALQFGSFSTFQDLYTNPRASHLDLMRPRRDCCKYNNWLLHHQYLFPWYRIGPYLLGILTGHYAFMVRSGKWKSILYKHPNSKEQNGSNQQLRNFLLNLLLYSGLVLMFCMFFSSYLVDQVPLPESGEYVKIIGSIVYSSHHNFSGLGMALTIVALIFGHQKLRAFMSKPFWAIVSRMNYIVLMIHVEVMWMVFLSSSTMSNLTDFDFVNILISFCFYSYLIAGVLAPLLEIPLSQLELEFVAAALKPRPKSTSAQEPKRNSKVSTKKRD